MSPSCPLCHSLNPAPIRSDKFEGAVFLCADCDLIFKSNELHLDFSQQKSRYDLHQNEIDNPGYIEFFEQLLNPLQPYLKPEMRALDWGAGPGGRPVLAELLRRRGLLVEIYDPIYHPQVPEGRFDLITCTEVMEHFLEPEKSLRSIFSKLKRPGFFASMTGLHKGPEMFKDWWYAKDPTHVVFYSERTVQWIAQKFDFEILHLQSPVFLLKGRSN